MRWSRCRRTPPQAGGEAVLNTTCCHGAGRPFPQPVVRASADERADQKHTNLARRFRFCPFSKWARLMIPRKHFKRDRQQSLPSSRGSSRLSLVLPTHRPRHPARHVRHQVRTEPPVRASKYGGKTSLVRYIQRKCTRSGRFPPPQLLPRNRMHTLSHPHAPSVARKNQEQYGKEICTHKLPRQHSQDCAPRHQASRGLAGTPRREAKAARHTRPPCRRLQSCRLPPTCACERTTRSGCGNTAAAVFATAFFSRKLSYPACVALALDAVQ